MELNSTAAARRPLSLSSASLQPPSPSPVIRRQSVASSASLGSNSPTATRRPSAVSTASVHPPSWSTRRQSGISSASLHPPLPKSARRHSTASVRAPPASSSSTLVVNSSPTTIPTQCVTPTLKSTSSHTVQDLTRTSLHTRVKRQLTKLVRVRRPLPAPLLSTTLAFILLHDTNGATTCLSPRSTGALDPVSDTLWSKFWIPSTGQPCSPANSCADLCALASATRPSTLNASLKHWLLVGCTRRWPAGEPLVPLDVLAHVHGRLHKYETSARVQRAVEKRLASTQAVDFALVAAHLRGLVAMWPNRAQEIVDEWILMLTRFEEQIGRVRADVGKEEREWVMDMCRKVFRAVVDETVNDQGAPVRGVRGCDSEPLKGAA